MKGNRVYLGKKRRAKVPYHRHQVAHFYSSTCLDEGMDLSTQCLSVLEEENMGGVPIQKCNVFENFDTLHTIHQTIQRKIPVGRAAAYHVSVDTWCDFPTAFYGHRDKIIFGDGPTVFLAVEGTCTILIACPGHEQSEADRLRARVRLQEECFRSTGDARFGVFETEFFKESGCASRNDIQIFTLEPGDFISFDATQLYHAVIIHPHLDGRRRLLVFHSRKFTTRTVS